MASKDSVKLKLKFSRNMKIVLLTFVLVIMGGLIYSAYNTYLSPKSITAWNYYGRILYFRADLKAADEVPVYPNEDAVRLDLVHGLAKNVTFAYKFIDEPTSENAYYTLQIIEITRNIIPAYEHIFKFTPNFNSTKVDSYENLPGKIQNPIIAIVPPPYSDETAIRTDYHVTYLKAKTYEDLDLVVTKLLMIALGIDLDETI